MTDRAREIAHKYVHDMEGVYCYRERHSHICDNLTADIVRLVEWALSPPPLMKYEDGKITEVICSRCQGPLVGPADRVREITENT